MNRKPEQGLLFTTDTRQPTRARPGSLEKIEILRERLEKGEELWHPQDRHIGGEDAK